MAKDKNLDQNEKVNMFEYTEIADQLIEQKKRLLADLQHNYVITQTALSQLQQKIAEDKVAFSQWKQVKEAQGEKDLQKRQSDMEAKEHALRVNSENYDKRSMELKQREVAIAHLFEERQKLNTDRIDVERLRTKAEESMNHAVRKASEAQAVYNSARVSEEESKKSAEKAIQLNAENVRRENELKLKMDDLALRTRNFEELKKVVEPKIKELELIKNVIDAKEKSVAEQERDISRKIEEDRAIVIAFSDREKKLKSREVEVDTREQEVARKMLMLKAEK